MAISWSTVLDTQAKGLDAELARRELEQSGLLKTVQQAENMRQNRAQEEHQAKQLEETTKLRQASEEETRRRNRESEEDRDNARFVQTLDRLSKGDVVTDPSFMERVTKNGFTPRFKPNGDGSFTYLGTPRENEALSRLKQADQRIKDAEARAASVANQASAALQAANYWQMMRDRDRDADRELAVKREQRLQAAQERLGTLTPQQLTAFRLSLQQKMKENAGKGGVLADMGIGKGPKDNVDLIDEALSEVMRVPTGVPTAPIPTHAPAAAPGAPKVGTSAPKPGTPAAAPAAPTKKAQVGRFTIEY